MNIDTERLSEYKNLTAEIRKYNEAYEAGEAIISDYEYDRLMLRLKAMEREDIAVILMTEKLVSLCPDIVYDLKLNRKKPLIVEIPDRHGNGRTKDSITKYVQDAIGVKL